MARLFSMKLDDGSRAVIEAAAARSGTSLSAFIRGAALEAAARLLASGVGGGKPVAPLPKRGFALHPRSKAS